MERRRTNLIYELREAREELLNINFAIDTTDRIRVSRPYALVDEWLNKWNSTFRKYSALSISNRRLDIRISSDLDGYRQETDVDIFNELRPLFVGYIDDALNQVDQEYEVKPLLEDYIKRVKDTKLAELLKEFNAAKDIAPNLVAIGFRTILSLVIQERAKREKPSSNTATQTDLALDNMIRIARADGILSGDEQRLLDSFKSTHKDIYDFISHRPNLLIDKSEVDTMVDLLNKLLPSIIN